MRTISILYPLMTLITIITTKNQRQDIFVKYNQILKNNYKQVINKL